MSTNRSRCVQQWVTSGVTLAVGGSVWFTAIGFLNEGIADDFRLAPAWRGVVPAAFYAGMGVGAVVLGLLSDGRGCAAVGRPLAWASGRRRVALLSLALAGLAALLSSAMPSVGALIPTIIAIGAGVGGCIPAAESLFAETTTLSPAERSRWVTLLGAWYGLGAIPSALVIGAILSHGRDLVALAPWRLMLIVFGTLELATAFLLVWIMPESEKWRALRGRSSPKTAVSAALLDPLLDADLPQRSRAGDDNVVPVHIFNRSLRTTTLLLWATWFGFNFAVSGFTAFLPQLLDSGGSGSGAASTPPPRDGDPATWHRQAEEVAIYSLAALPGVLFAALLVRWRGGRRIALASCVLLTATCTALFAWRSASHTALLILGCASAFFSNGAWASLALVTVEAYPTHLRATGFGWAHGFHSIAGALGPYVGGWFIGRSANVVALGAFAGACAAAGVAACALRPAVQEEEEEKEEEEEEEELFEIGGVAPPPHAPPLLRRRRCTGIGNETRMVEDPERREAMVPAVCAALPTHLRSAIAGLPLLVRVRKRKPYRGGGDGALTGASASVAASAQHGGGESDVEAAETMRPVDSLEALGAAARKILDARLHDAGVVLLKDLPIESAADFNRFVVGMNYQGMATMGASERERKAANVFGASDDVPATHTLHPHNEQAYLGAHERPSYPRKIFFCCLEVAPEGGETPFLLNAELTQRLRPDIIKRFKARGVAYKQVLPGGGSGEAEAMSENLGGMQTWQKMFGCNNAEEVERLAAARGYHFAWDDEDDDSSRIRLNSSSSAAEGKACVAATCVGSAGATAAAARGVAPRDRSRCALTITSPRRDAFLHGNFWNQASNVFSFVPCWGDDGTPIEEPVLEHLNAAMWHSARAFGWCKGDVMCVDNEVAMHARTSFVGPRTIVVAFSKT